MILLIAVMALFGCTRSVQKSDPFSKPDVEKPVQKPRPNSKPDVKKDGIILENL
jgi:hypothetical protein